MWFQVTRTYNLLRRRDREERERDIYIYYGVKYIQVYDNYGKKKKDRMSFVTSCVQRDAHGFIVGINKMVNR